MNISGNGYSELWVCFKPPRQDPPPHSLILGFMGPEAELEFEKGFGERFINGRLVAQTVREAARKAYLAVSVQLAATPSVFGKTLRQMLKGKDGISRWWYHLASRKECVDSNDPYTLIIQLYCVKLIAEEHRIKQIKLVGSRRSFASCLQNAFCISLHQRTDKLQFLTQLYRLLYGLLGRIYFIFYRLCVLIIIKWLPSHDGRKLDIMLQAFWDWSITPESDTELKDRYFVDLPRRLRNMGFSVGYLGIFSPKYQIWQRGRSLKKVASDSVKHPEVILLERYLSLYDVLRVGLNMSYFMTWLMFSFSAKFKVLFIQDGLDLYPLFKDALVCSFWGNSIPYHELVSIATERACESLQPKIIVTFLEFFLASRSIYVGAKQANSETIVFAAQHAAYCSDKTYGVLDRIVELKGHPDSCPMPVPDGIFAMGELSYDMWIKNGFSEDQVILSGGLRYEHVGAKEKYPGKRLSETLSILLIGGMNEYMDFDMCEAVYAATKEMDSVLLTFRNHPSYHITDMKDFRRFKPRIKVSRGSVAEDLSNADLIIFTHSSLPEEALLLGIPVWQWLWSGFNTSVFLDLQVIPTFTSVLELRAAIRHFAACPDDYRPTEEVKQLILRKCFGPNPGDASRIISLEIAKRLRSLSTA